MTDTGDPSSQTAPGHSPWFYRIPILASALLICLINGYNLQRLVRAECATEPWEAAEVVEAWAVCTGCPSTSDSRRPFDAHVRGARPLGAGRDLPLGRSEQHVRTRPLPGLRARSP